MNSNGFPLVKYDKHSTKRQSITPKDLSEEATDKILKFYEKDFKNYNYSTNPAEYNFVPETIEQEQRLHPLLVEFSDFHVECKNFIETNRLSTNLSRILDNNTYEGKIQDLFCALFHLNSNRLA